MADHFYGIRVFMEKAHFGTNGAGCRPSGEGGGVGSASEPEEANLQTFNPLIMGGFPSPECAGDCGR